MFEGDQVARNVTRVIFAEAKAGHDGHVLDLEFMAVIGTTAVRQIEHVWQAFLRVVLGTDVLFLVWAIRAGALARIVYPADEVIVARLLADSGQVGGEAASGGRAQ